jgi:hypothetical protein
VKDLAKHSTRRTTSHLSSVLCMLALSASSMQPVQPCSNCERRPSAAILKFESYRHHPQPRAEEPAQDEVRGVDVIVSWNRCTSSDRSRFAVLLIHQHVINRLRGALQHYLGHKNSSHRLNVGRRCPVRVQRLWTSTSGAWTSAAFLRLAAESVISSVEIPQRSIRDMLSLFGQTAWAACRSSHY